MNKKWLACYEQGIQGNLEYPKINLSEMLTKAAQNYPDNTSMIYMTYKWSYHELDVLASQVANLLITLGIKPGDRVGLQLLNSPQFVFLYFGILRAGATVVMINSQYAKDDYSFILQNSNAKIIFTYNEHLANIYSTTPKHVQIIVTDISQKFSICNTYTPSFDVQKLENLLNKQSTINPKINIPPYSVAALLFTGGTTGVPKAVTLTHQNLIANASQLRHWFKRAYQDGKGSFLCVIPFFHIYGMTTNINMPVISGSTMILLPKFDLNQLISSIETYKPNIFMGVPAMYGTIISRVGEHDLSSIKACISGSAPLPLAVQDAFEKLTGGKVREGYGLTEASVVACNPIYGKSKTGSIGLPFPDTEIKILDLETGEVIDTPEVVGELSVKGPQVMMGYWENQEETNTVLNNGWLRTGDLAYMDEEGYIYIVDRLKDMIIMGGEKIYPREVEEVLYTHPGVQEVGVVGLQHKLRGEVPVAFVVKKETTPVTEKELKQFCAKHLTKFKVPYSIIFVDSLPRSTVGKVLRRSLREKVLQMNEIAETAITTD